MDLRRDFPQILAEGATLAGAAAADFSAYELRKNAGRSAQKKRGNPELPHEPENYSDFLAEVFANIEDLPQSARRLKRWRLWAGNRSVITNELRHGFIKALLGVF